MKQDSLRHKNEKKPSMTLSYRELKEMASVHQHAILIDCSKLTLPLFVNFSLILISDIKVSNRSVVQYYTHTACFEEYFKGCYIKEQFKTSAKSPKNYLGPVVRKVDSSIHWIVSFSIVVKMLQKL